MHPSHDVLALLALGEHAGSDSERSHVRDCTECGSEVSGLTRLADLGRGVGPAALDVPPSYVWDRISTELGLQTGSGTTLARPVESPYAAERTAGSADPDATSRPGPDRPPTASRRRRSVLVSAVAAVLALLVGIAAGVGISRYQADHQQRVVARATLTGLPGWAGATGHAVLQVDKQGVRRLEITMTGPPVRNALTEAWLAKPDLSGMVALGQMDEGSGTFSVPDGVDVGQYSVVDVSKQPLNGTVQHSDESIVRGQLA